MAIDHALLPVTRRDTSASDIGVASAFIVLVVGVWCLLLATDPSMNATTLGSNALLAVPALGAVALVRNAIVTAWLVVQHRRWPIRVVMATSPVVADQIFSFVVVARPAGYEGEITVEATIGVTAIERVLESVRNHGSFRNTFRARSQGGCTFDCQIPAFDALQHPSADPARAWLFVKATTEDGRVLHGSVSLGEVHGSAQPSPEDSTGGWSKPSSVDSNRGVCASTPHARDPYARITEQIKKLRQHEANQKARAAEQASQQAHAELVRKWKWLGRPLPRDPWVPPKTHPHDAAPRRPRTMFTADERRAQSRRRQDLATNYQAGPELRRLIDRTPPIWPPIRDRTPSAGVKTNERQG